MDLIRFRQGFQGFCCFFFKTCLLLGVVVGFCSVLEPALFVEPRNPTTTTTTTTATAATTAATTTRTKRKKKWKRKRRRRDAMKTRDWRRPCVIHGTLWNDTDPQLPSRLFAPLMAAHYRARACVTELFFLPGFGISCNGRAMLPAGSILIKLVPRFT